MRQPVIAILCVAFLASGCARQPSDSTAVTLESDEDKTLYTIGLALARNVAVFEFTPEELAAVQAGFADGVMNREPKVDIEEYLPKIRDLQVARMEAAAETERREGEALLAQAATQDNTVRTESGLVITTIEEGSGASPKATDNVQVHYHGTLRDGKVFDSSIERNQPATFPLNQVIPCWTEALQMMKVGGKARVVCPSNTAYGDRGAPPDIKPGAVLTFDVELLDIVG